MGTDSFDKYNYKVEGLVCSKPEVYQVWLGYRTEIFSLRDWTMFYNWDEDEYTMGSPLCVIICAFAFSITPCALITT